MMRATLILAHQLIFFLMLWDQQGPLEASLSIKRKINYYKSVITDNFFPYVSAAAAEDELLDKGDMIQ